MGTIYHAIMMTSLGSLKVIRFVQKTDSCDQNEVMLRLKKILMTKRHRYASLPNSYLW